MYKPDMASPFQNNIRINTLSPKPGITIWYARIPDIVHAVFSKGTYHNFKPMVNEIFQKESFAVPFLSHGEIRTINGFKALKKQIEWISGRYIIKQMIHHLFLAHLPLDHITLSYLSDGAPFVTNYPDIPISLSHSNEYTAAACCKDKGQTIGLDIERVAKKPDAYFLKTAFTQDEILNLKDDAVDIFRHWTIKEAYLKYIKKGFNESLHRVEVVKDEIRHNSRKIDLDIYSTLIDSAYVLSLVSD